MTVVKDSAIETGSVSIIIAAAALFGWALSNEQVPQQFAQFLVDNISNKWLILLLINVMLFTLGMFMDSIPAIMIVTPVLLPLFRMLEIDPLHAGVFMSVNLITGLATPPVGCCLFAAAIISNESMERISLSHIAVFGCQYLRRASGYLCSERFNVYSVAFSIGRLPGNLQRKPFSTKAKFRTADRPQNIKIQFFDQIC